jgi:hypothetical protein
LNAFQHRFAFSKMRQISLKEVGHCGNQDRRALKARKSSSRIKTEIALTVAAMCAVIIASAFGIARIKILSQSFRCSIVGICHPLMNDLEMPRHHHP